MNTTVKEMLRPYQLATCTALDKELIGGGKSTIMALPTGSGKTLTAVYWLYDRFLKNGCRVLWWVHRVELLDQADRDLQEPTDPGGARRGRSRRVSQDFLIGEIDA